MKIDKIEIDGFGKWNQVSFTFSDGFNLIVGDNESGKSTLCEFLLAMFYELPNSLKKTTKYDDGRKLYRPWNGTSFGGRVYFTDDGVKYVLEKSFGKTKNSDRTKLLFADTWEPAGDAEGVGERFFGMGREAFLKTLYVKSLDANSTVGSEEIMEKLSNMETGADEDISYNKIKAAIEKAHAQIATKTGRGGKRPLLEDKKQSLETEKAILLRKKELLEEIEKQIASLSVREAELTEAKKTAEASFKIAKEHAAYELEKQASVSKEMMSARYHAECQRLAEMKLEYEELAKQSNNSVPESVLTQAKELEKQFIIAESKTEEWNRIRQEKMKQSETNTRGRAKRLQILAFIAETVGVLLLGTGIFLKSFAAVFIGVIGIVAGIVAVALIKQSPTGKTMPKEPSPTEEAERFRQKLESFCKTYGADTMEELEEIVRGFAQIQKKMPQLQEQIQCLEKEIESIPEHIAKIRIPEAKEYTEEVKSYQGESAEVLEEAVRNLAAELEVTKESLHGKCIELTKETAGEKTIAEVETAILAAEEEIDRLKKQEEAFGLAESWLEKAHREIKENFAPRLNQKTGEIFSELTGGKYGEVRIGEGFRLHYKNENGEITDSDALSSGTYDMLYIALRLATLAVLFDDAVPTVILDDAFSQMDDARYHRVVSYIKHAAIFGQVISLTCHRASVDLLEKENINLIDFNQEGVLDHGLQN